MLKTKHAFIKCGAEPQNLALITSAKYRSNHNTLDTLARKRDNRDMREYHLGSTPSIARNRRRRKKLGKRGPVFEKLDSNFQSGNKIPDYLPPPGRDTKHIPSLSTSVDPEATARRSMMEHVLTGNESDETKAEIIRKSKCIVPAYNKGAVQYISSESAAKDAGR